MVREEHGPVGKREVYGIWAKLNDEKNKDCQTLEGEGIYLPIVLFCAFFQT
jgi:hypothetical protein